MDSRSSAVELMVSRPRLSTVYSQENIFQATSEENLQQSEVAVVDCDRAWKHRKYEIEVDDREKGDMKQSVKGISVSWSKLVYEDARTSKQILKGITGIARPGRILAVMGPSGAGKTTLLQCLSQRSPSSGTIMYGGNCLRSSNKMRRMFAYCHQVDLFRENLTVREHLYVQAKLRMKFNIDYDGINNHLNKVIGRLGLTKCQHSIIGSPGEGGISGGERRRLSIASEILNRPPILFLDEPTSGLDSSMALSIIRMLKEIVKQVRIAFIV